MQSPNSNADLLQIHFQSMLVAWGENTPLRSGLHASSVLMTDGEWCVREHVLAALYPDQAVKPTQQWRTNAIFLNGWRLHEKWQDLFKRFGECLEFEKAHYDDVREFWFTPDAIIRFAGQEYLVEIKGYNLERYNSLVEPPKAAVVQAQLYMHLLQIKQAIILVECKDNQDFKVYVVEYDPAVSVPYMQRVYDVKGKIILANVMESRTIARICQSSTQARALRCPMRQTCFSIRSE